MRVPSVIRRAASVAFAAAAVIAAFAATPALAQVCAYNSTQATCACPTAGGGTTCFGGQLYRSTDGSCQDDIRPCASSSQQFNCASVACQCTAGTTLCVASGVCVTNIACPAGTTFDPCTSSCVTPNVLLSPGSTQTGFIQVSGDVKSTAGDFSLANGKAIRVDGAGTTSLNIGNWGGGGTGVKVNFPASSQLCFGAACRTSWPSTTDFDPTYINNAGDTMTGDLYLTGATTQLGIGTTTPGAGLDVQNGSLMVGGTGAYPTWAGGNGMFFYTDKGAFRAGNGDTTDWGDANIGVNSVAMGRGTSATGFTSFAFGDFTDATSDYAYAFGRNSTASAADALALGYAARATNTHTYAIGSLVEATAANSFAMGRGYNAAPLVNNIANSFMIGMNSNIPTLFVGGGGLNTTGNVGIGTSTPGYKLDVAGTAAMTGFRLTTGAANGRVLTSDATGNGTWQVLSVPVNSVSGSGAGISVSPTTGNVVVSNTGVTSLVAGTDTTVSGSTGAVTVGNNSTLQTVTNRGNTTTNGIVVNTSSAYGVDSTGVTSGVYGRSSSGIGVQGTSTSSTGVQGNGFYGVLGSGTNTGVYATGSTTGVYGTGSTYGGNFVSAGTGVYVNGTNYGVYSASAANNFFQGRVGVGFSNPPYSISTTGDVYAQGAVTSGAFTPAGYGFSGQGVNGGAYLYDTNNGTNVTLASNGYTLNGAGSLYNNGPAGFGGAAPNANYGVISQGNWYGVQGTGNTGVQGTSSVVNGNGGSFSASGGGSSMGVYANGVYSLYGVGTLENWGDLNLNGKLALRGNDSWLRLNNNGQFTSGIYTPGALRVDGSLTVYGTLTQNYYSSWWNADAWNDFDTAWVNTGESDYDKMCVLTISTYEDNGGECHMNVYSGVWWMRAYSYATPSHVYCMWRCYKFR